MRMRTNNRGNKVILPSGIEQEVLSIVRELNNYELIFIEDTKQIGVKLPNDTIFVIGETLDWDNLPGKPIFSQVAYTGEYEDLLNKPDLNLKLDKDFNKLQEAVITLSTDILVINRLGTDEPQRITIETLFKNYLDKTEVQNLINILNQSIQDLRTDLNRELDLIRTDIEGINLKGIGQDNRLDVIESDIIDLEGLVKIDDKTITRNDDQELEVNLKYIMDGGYL